MMTMMMKKYDFTEENLKEISTDISGMNQKVESYASSNKHIEQQLG